MTHHNYEGDVMKSLLFSILLLIGTSSSAVAQDFRSHNWGATVEKVKQVEGEPAHETDDRLMYQANIIGLSAYLAFDFVEGQLASAVYLFTETHVNDNLFLNDFGSIDGLLTERYGNPDDEQTIWSNNLYRDDPEHYGMAVSMGHMAKETTWETDRTTIRHVMRGDNFEVSHGIAYQGKMMEELQEEARRREALDQL
jgi:hypothetical protein